MSKTSLRRLCEMAGITPDRNGQDKHFPIGVVYIPQTMSRGIMEQIGVFTNIRISIYKFGDVVYYGDSELDVDAGSSKSTENSYVAIGDSDIIIAAASNEDQAWNLLRRELIKDGLDAEVATFIDAVKGKPTNTLYEV